MKVKITRDEWYPVYGTSEYSTCVIEVPADLWARHITAMTEANATNAEIHRLYMDARMPKAGAS